MAEITDDQIDYIISDFAKRGIVLEDLRDNLLDHMCCIIENEMNQNDDFYRFYDTVLPRFFKKNLSEIQTETENLLKFKNFYTMKKTMNITGIMTVILLLSGAILKTLHLPGAGITLVSGGSLFSLIFLPLLMAIKFKDDNNLKDKIVFSFGLFLGMILSAGFIFKMMHWPYANMLMLWGTVVFTFCYVPIYFITRIKRAELKFNTIVNSVLMFACGGILFGMINLRNSHLYDQAVSKNHQSINDNTNKVIKSNHYLYDLDKSSSYKNLHLITDSIIKQTDKAISIINNEENQDQLKKAQNDLHRICEKYNQEVKIMKTDNVQSIDVDLLERKENILKLLGPSVSQDFLLSIKQQVAVNENAYLVQLL